MKEINNHIKEKDMDKYLTELTNLTITCKKCGHRIQFIGRRDRIICSWCGHWIYKDAKTEFKYKIQENKRKRK